MRRRAWVIRGGEDNELVDRFVELGIVAVGFPDVPDGRRVDRYEITERLRERGWTQPETRAELFVQFVHQVASGHFVVLPDTRHGDVVIGRVAGDYEHGPALDADDGYRHRRRVDWLGRHGRAALPQASRDLLRQRAALVEQTSPALLEHLESVERGDVPVRAPEDTSPPPPAPRTPRSPRAATTTRSPRAAAAPAPAAPPTPTTRTCTSCVLTKSLDLFPGGGETCVDCE